jgi:hypothetical protein
VYFLQNSHLLPMASHKMSVLLQSLGYLSEVSPMSTTKSIRRIYNEFPFNVVRIHDLTQPL